MSGAEIEALYNEGVIPGPSPEPPSGPNSPVGHWTMDDDASNTTVVDSSVYGNDGTAQQNTEDLNVSGVIEGALTFNGSSDYIDCGDDAGLVITDEITISVWINAPTMPDDALWAIVSSQDDGSHSGVSMILDGRVNPDGQRSPHRHIHFQIGDGSWHTTNVNAAVPTDQWVHIVATRKANEDAKVYYNAVSQPLAGVLWNGSVNYTANWNIGRQPDIGGWRYFKGTIDDVRIYNRALSGAEIEALYNEGVGI